MNNFRGGHRKKAYFEGWYLKHQKDNTSIAFIPAFHVSENGKRTASVQVVTEEGAYCFSFEEKEFYASKKQFYVKINHNVFSEGGISVNLRNENVTITGTLYYSPFTGLLSDIMGPFRFLPFMQCRHGILSMLHSISGRILINGREYDFSNGTGYVEKDCGSSFPRFYTWIQCSGWTGKRDCSLVVSAAHIPFGCFTFTGCICAILYQGREYRLATYTGARIAKNTENTLIINQGKYKLEIYKVWEEAKENGKSAGAKEKRLLLYAPQKGSMCRKIEENIACAVRCRFTASGKKIFDFTDDRASFEYVGKQDGY
ncbi:tocopherol cyclase-like protein [Kineothrix alysoides]|uniref:Tocopherol cyclase-like protein n=1 Tax=Kineothrix alysoides TaxID=1469948 RepID=A0A4R1QKQ8_9FIRM|nr:tocopherol cyclase family protein [Kineothrix alysoides]TCL54258.1 tocopherol cyclase-like protein [Kineothrix alysoides]